MISLFSASLSFFPPIIFSIDFFSSFYSIKTSKFNITFSFYHLHAFCSSFSSHLSFSLFFLLLLFFLKHFVIFADTLIDYFVPNFLILILLSYCWSISRHCLNHYSYISRNISLTIICSIFLLFIPLSLLHDHCHILQLSFRNAQERILLSSSEAVRGSPISLLTGRLSFRCYDIYFIY